MDQVSRPVQIALLATVLFGAAWFLVLRPKPADGGGAPAATPAAQEAPAAPGAEGLSNAVDRAEDAVATANGDAPTTEGGDTAATAPAPADPAPAAARRRRRPAAAVEGSGPVRAALRQHKALALAFVDPRTADARAVRAELTHVSRFGGRAVVLPIPIASLSRYEFITREVEVTVAPTVVIVAPDRSATTIVGFADRAEIEQGIADALKRRR